MNFLDSLGKYSPFLKSAAQFGQGYLADEARSKANKKTRNSQSMANFQNALAGMGGRQGNFRAQQYAPEQSSIMKILGGVELGADALSVYEQQRKAEEDRQRQIAEDKRTAELRDIQDARTEGSMEAQAAPTVQGSSPSYQPPDEVPGQVPLRLPATPSTGTYARMPAADPSDQTPVQQAKQTSYNATANQRNLEEQQRAKARQDIERRFQHQQNEIDESKRRWGLQQQKLEENQQRQAKVQIASSINGSLGAIKSGEATADKEIAKASRLAEAYGYALDKGHLEALQTAGAQSLGVLDLNTSERNKVAEDTALQGQAISVFNRLNEMDDATADELVGRLVSIKNRIKEYTAPKDLPMEYWELKQELGIFVDTYLRVQTGAAAPPAEHQFYKSVLGDPAQTKDALMHQLGGFVGIMQDKKDGLLSMKVNEKMAGSAPPQIAAAYQAAQQIYAPPEWDDYMLKWAYYQETLKARGAGR